MKNEIYQPHKSTCLDVDANFIALIAYLLSFIMSFIPILKYVSFFAPLIIFFVEKNSILVKFHSMQAFLLNVLGSVVVIIYSLSLGASLFGVSTLRRSATIASLGFIGVLSIIMIIFWIVIFVFNILAMIGAYQYKEYRIPIIGNWAAKISNID